MSSSLPTFSIDLGEDEFELSDSGEDDHIAAERRSHRPSVSDETFFHTSTPQEKPSTNLVSGKNFVPSQSTTSELLIERRYTPRPPTISPPPMDMITEEDDDVDEFNTDASHPEVELRAQDKGRVPNVSALMDKIASLEEYVERLRTVARQQIITAGQNSTEIIKLKGIVRSLQGENVEFRNRIEFYESKLELKSSYQQLEWDSYHYKHGLSPIRASNHSTNRDPSTPMGLSQDEKIQQLQEQMARLNALLLTPTPASNEDAAPTHDGNEKCEDDNNADTCHSGESSKSVQTVNEYLDMNGSGYHQDGGNSDVIEDVVDEKTVSDNWGKLLEPGDDLVAPSIAATSESVEIDGSMSMKRVQSNHTNEETRKEMEEGGIASNYGNDDDNATATVNNNCDAVTAGKDRFVTFPRTTADFVDDTQSLKVADDFKSSSSLTALSPDVVWTPANYTMEENEIMRASSNEEKLTTYIDKEGNPSRLTSKDIDATALDDDGDDDDKSSISDVQVTRVINPYPDLDAMANNDIEDENNEDRDDQQPAGTNDAKNLNCASSASPYSPDNVEITAVAESKSNDRNNKGTKSSRKRGSGSSAKNVGSSKKRGNIDTNDAVCADEKTDGNSVSLQKRKEMVEEIISESSNEDERKSQINAISPSSPTIDPNLDSNDVNKIPVSFCSLGPLQRPQIFGNKKSSSFQQDDSMEDYEEKKDPKSNKSYWRHKVTGKVTWKRPSNTLKGKNKNENDRTTSSPNHKD